MSIEPLIAMLLTTLGGSTAQVLYAAMKAILADRIKRDQPDLLADESPGVVTQSEITKLEAVLASIEKGEGFPLVASSTSSAISVALKSIQALREDRRKQAIWSFSSALVLAVIGTIVIIGSVIFMFVGGNLTAGSISAGAGIVAEIMSAVLFKLYRDANDRSDKVLRDAQILESAQIGIETATKIENQELRDQTLSQLAIRLASYSLKGTRETKPIEETPSE